MALLNQPAREQNRHGVSAVVDDRDWRFPKGRVENPVHGLRYRLLEFMVDLGRIDLRQDAKRSQRLQRDHDAAIGKHLRLNDAPS